MNYKHHFIKLECYNGKWFTYHNPSSARLKRLIQKHNPKNCYVSVNQYLRYKEHKQSYPNLLFKEHGLIDIDGQNFSSPEESRQYFISIVNFLIESNVEIEKTVCTNTTLGGFQVVIAPSGYDTFYMLLKNHPQRFEKADHKVFNDHKRVRRMEGTFNGNRGSFAVECD